MADQELPPIPKTAKGFFAQPPCASNEVWLGSYCARERVYEGVEEDEVDPRKWTSWCFYDAARRGYSDSQHTQLSQYSAYRLAQRINSDNPLATGITINGGWQPNTKTPDEVRTQVDSRQKPEQPGMLRIDHHLCAEGHQCESVYIKTDEKWHIFCALVDYLDESSEAEQDADEDDRDTDQDSDCGQSGSRHFDESDHDDAGSDSGGEGGYDWDLQLGGIRRHFGADFVVDADINDASLELLLLDDKHKHRVGLGKDVSILLNGVETPLCTTAYDTFGSCEPATSRSFKAHDKIHIHFSVGSHSLPANLHFGLTSFSKCLPP